MLRSKNPIVLRLYVTKKCGLHCGYCIDGGMQPYYAPPPVDAKYEDTKQLIDECPELGVKFVEFAGGNPLEWWPMLPRILAYCKKKRPELFTLLPVSGLGLTNYLNILQPEWLPDPNLLRISIHYNSKGIVSFESLYEGLKVVKKYRSEGKTQLGVVLIPGREGNLRQELLEPVLTLARDLSYPIHISMVLGTWRNGNWNKYKNLWRTISDSDRTVLNWFIGQPVVMVQSREKAERCLAGGNDRNNPSCQAGISVITIRNNRLIDPCAINPCLCEDIKDSLADTLRSKERMTCEKPGTYDYCDGCTYECSDVTGALLDSSDPIETYCSM